VVAALQHGALALAVRDRTGAVAADVRERAQLAVIAADDEERLVGDLRGEVAARLRDLLRAPDELPGLGEDRPLLGLEHRGVEVPARRQRRRARKVRFELPVHRSLRTRR
jgi:hypothetical protein